MKLKTRAILLIDPIIAPITQWLAFESSLNDIRSLIPPKESKTLIKRARKKARCLPKHLRGAFLYLIIEKIKGNMPGDIAITLTLKDMQKDYNLGGELCQ